ncbi:MAG: UDP-3-O-acyl-N-acetylglucosamine deacetylase [Phycisphaerales bacterium]
MTPGLVRLRAEASLEGPGLFTGRAARLAVAPAAAGTGLVFVVAGRRIPARIEHLETEPVVPAFASVPARHTNLSADGATAVTVEHALAALAGLGVADAELRLEDLDDPSRTTVEVPIGDGSAQALVEALRHAGLEPTELETPVILVRETITVQDDAGGMLVAEPAALPDCSYLLDYGGTSAPVPKQSSRWTLEDADSRRTFAEQIAPARTFSLRAEAEQMQKLGLFASFTPADLLVLDDDGSPIDNSLRFENEPARHKLLDLIGDLALAGRPILGRVSAYRSGHALNHEMARRLADL